MATKMLYLFILCFPVESARVKYGAKRSHNMQEQTENMLESGSFSSSLEKTLIMTDASNVTTTNTDRLNCRAADILDMNLPPSDDWTMRIPIVSPKGPSGNMYIGGKDIQITSVAGQLRFMSEPSEPGTFTYSFDSNDMDGRAKVGLQAKVRIATPPGVLGALIDLFVGDQDLDITAWVQYKGKAFQGKDGNWTFKNEIESASFDLGKSWFSLWSLIQGIVNMWGGLQKIIFDQIEGILEMLMPHKNGDPSRAEARRQLDKLTQQFTNLTNSKGLQDFANSIDLSGISMEIIFDIFGKQLNPDSDFTLEVQGKVKTLAEVSSWLSREDIMTALIGNASSQALIEKVRSLGSEFDAFSGTTAHLNVAVKREEAKGVDAAVSAGFKKSEDYCSNSDEHSPPDSKSISEIRCDDYRGTITQISSAYLTKSGWGALCSPGTSIESVGDELLTVLHSKLLSFYQLTREVKWHAEKPKPETLEGAEQEATAGAQLRLKVMQDLMAASNAAAEVYASHGEAGQMIQDVKSALDSSMLLAMTTQEFALIKSLFKTTTAIEQFLEANKPKCRFDVTKHLSTLCTGVQSCKIPSNRMLDAVPTEWREKCSIVGTPKLIVHWTCKRTEVSSALNAVKFGADKGHHKDFYFDEGPIRNTGFPPAQTQYSQTSKILKFVHDDPKFMGFSTQSDVQHGVMFRLLVAQSGTYSLKFRAAFHIFPFITSNKPGKLHLTARLAKPAKWVSSTRKQITGAYPDWQPSVPGLTESYLYREVRNLTMDAKTLPRLTMVDLFDSIYMEVGEHFVELELVDQQRDLRNHLFCMDAFHLQTVSLDQKFEEEVNVPSGLISLFTSPQTFTGHSEEGGVWFGAQGHQYLDISESAYQSFLKDLLKPDREKLSRTGKYDEATPLQIFYYTADGPVPSEFMRKNSREPKVLDLTSLVKFDIQPEVHVDISHKKMSHRTKAEPLIVMEFALSSKVDLQLKELIETLANPPSGQSENNDFGYMYMQSQNWKERGAFTNEHVDGFYLMNCGVIDFYHMNKAAGHRWAHPSYEIEELGPLHTHSKGGDCPTCTKLFCVSEEMKFLEICHPDQAVIQKWKEAIELQMKRFKDPRAKLWSYGTHNQTLSSNLPLKPAGVAVGDPSQDYVAASQ